MKKNKKCDKNCKCGCQEGKKCTCKDEKCICGCNKGKCTCDDNCKCGCKSKK